VTTGFFYCPVSKTATNTKKSRFIKGEKTMAEVESFTLDHTAVKAPYVRLIAAEHGNQGDMISNFDVRLVQPNENAIPTAGLHTIEHLLAGLLRDHLASVIDCSPFGCRTGFHLITWGKPSTEDVAIALKESLAEIRDTIEWQDVQGTDKFSCGNYKDHSLFSAKKWSAEILDQGITSDLDVRHVV
jgi:S-ribosylhomocysteine lyase